MGVSQNYVKKDNIMIMKIMQIFQEKKSYNRANLIDLTS